MSIHRTDREAYSLFLVADRLPLLLEGIYEEPELTVIVSEALHAVMGHRRRGDPHEKRLMPVFRIWHPARFPFPAGRA